MLSKSCEYGLRAMLYLASLNATEYVSIRSISEALDISFHFLTKTFQKLTDAGLLVSQRGPAGGVRLARPPRQITPLEILVAIDGSALFTECVLGLPGCGDEKPCPLHEEWAAERARLASMFETVSIADLSTGFRNGAFRLKAIWDMSEST